MIQIRWHGRGGQGSFTASRVLGAAASVHGGKYAMAFPSFGPERRGAPVLGFTKIDDSPITDRSEVLEPDYVIVLDESLWDQGVLTGLTDRTVVVVNTAEPDRYNGKIAQEVITVDATSLALEILGLPITNTAMMGAFVAVCDEVSLEAVLKAIDEGMRSNVAEKNKRLIERVYHLVKEA